jgi:hypothetical protein
MVKERINANDEINIGRSVNIKEEGHGTDGVSVKKFVSIEDKDQGNDEVNISRFRTGSLLPCARNLAKIAKLFEENEVNSQCNVISCIVMCGTALEASLFEYAYFNEKQIYDDTDNFINRGMYKKYKMLFGKKLKKDFQEVNELVDFRNAIVHNEPDHKSGRERDLAKELNADKALWAVTTTEEFVKHILGKDY